MKEIDFRNEDWMDARKIFDFFRCETTCFQRDGKLSVKPKYVVAIGDDMVSAYYAAVVMKQAKLQFGRYPRLLCVGGSGAMSKYLNRLPDGTVLSNGMMLRMTALKFGNFPVSVLDHGNNIGADVREIADYMMTFGDSEEPVIFCVTQRLSKILERTVAYSSRRFARACPLDAYYYVPGEEISEICQLYNGRALAGGLPLLSEAAALYDSVGTGRYANRYMEEYDGMIPKYVIQAGMRLIEKYPMQVSRFFLNAPLQHLKTYYAIHKYRKMVADDMEMKIQEWKRQI